MYTVCYVLVDDESLRYYNEMMISLISLRKQQFSGAVIILTDEMTAAELKKQKRYEYKEMGNAELRIIEISDTYSQVEKSRFLKTTMRDNLEGDFLYLDSDTVVAEPLPLQFDQELGLVIDYHVDLSTRKIEYLININKLGGYTLDIFYPYYNGGVIWAKDTGMVHDFFNCWHKEWKQYIRCGMHFDQPSLNYVNRMKKSVIQKLPGIYNVQISARPTPINLFSRAKIIHYFNVDMEKIYLLQFSDVKEAGFQSETIQNIIQSPKEAFSKCVLINWDNKQIADDLTHRKIERLSYETNEQQNRIKWLQHDLDCIQSSVSYRIGRVITFFPRKLRDGIRCIHEKCHFEKGQ